jgi:pentatricopeptide repeat protein
MIKRAVEEFNNMKQLSIQPNIRTYNTLLRGCLRCGHLEEAKEIFKQVCDKGEADITSYEYFIKSLCQNLLVKEAWKLAKEIRISHGFEHAPLYSAISTAAALSGKFKLAKKTLKLAMQTLHSGVTNTQGMKNRGSVELFAKIRNEEVQRECSRVEAHLNKSKIPLLLVKRDIRNILNVIFFINQPRMK